MKPRNKFEKAILEQSKHLRPITKTQSKWAFRECIDHFAYRLPKVAPLVWIVGIVGVMNKHRELVLALIAGQSCRSRKHTSASCSRSSIFTLLTTCGEFQVLRMFLLIVGMEKGYKAQTSIIEVGQYWWNMQGRKSCGCHTESIGTLC